MKNKNLTANKSSEGKINSFLRERVLNPEELSDLLHIKVGTLYSHLSRDNPLPPSFKVGSQTRWRESVVWKWIEAKEEEQKRRNFE